MALRAIVLKPGECATLPSTATIKSVTLDGAISITSDCQNLPSPTDYVCYKFTWEDDDGGSMQDAYIDKVIIGTNSYTPPTAYNQYTQGQIFYLWLINEPALAGLIKEGCYDEPSTTNVIKIKVPAGIGAPQFKVINTSSGGFNNVSWLIGEVDEDCTDCSS